MGDHVLRAVALHGARIDRQAEALEGADHAMLGGGGHLAHLAPGIGEEMQGALCGDGGIKLAQRPRRRVARIGEDLVARSRLPLVQGGEIGVAHVDFAAHLEDLGRRPLQLVGDLANRAHIGGDVLALVAITARRRLHQFAPHITEGAGEPVDLGFGGEGQRSLRQPQKAPHAGDEFLDVFIGEDIAQGEHGHGMAHLGEFLGGRRAHSRGEERAAQFRKGRLQRLEAPPQGVVIRIRDDRRVFLMIADVVGLDLVDEALVLDARLARCELVYGGGLRHAPDVAQPLRRAKTGGGVTQPLAAVCLRPRGPLR